MRKQVKALVMAGVLTVSMLAVAAPASADSNGAEVVRGVGCFFWFDYRAGDGDYQAVLKTDGSINITCKFDPEDFVSDPPERPYKLEGFGFGGFGRVTDDCHLHISVTNNATLQCKFPPLP